MRRDLGFAEVLEHELGTRQPDTRMAGAPQTDRPAPPHPFLFAAPRFCFNSTAYASLTSAAGALRDAGSPACTPERPRRVRLLAARQERARGELVSLGADLPADFTAAELRRAFRALAHRYHPDSHPGSSDAATARLSRQFADLSENYRRLLAVFEPVGTTRH